MKNIIANEKAPIAIADFKIFENNSGSFYSKRYGAEGDENYDIYTYNVRLATVELKGGQAYLTYLDKTKYSKTSTRHMFYLMKGLKMSNIDHDLTELPTSWVKEITK
jgi:hypothetical protein